MVLEVFSNSHDSRTLKPPLRVFLYYDKIPSTIRGIGRLKIFLFFYMINRYSLSKKLPCSLLC